MLAIRRWGGSLFVTISFDRRMICVLCESRLFKDGILTFRFGQFRLFEFYFIVQQYIDVWSK